MKAVHPYLYFQGKTKEAFDFYQSVFGGEFLTVQRFRDIPDTTNIPEHQLDMLMHIALSLGVHTVLMGSDALETMGPKFDIGDNFSINISTDDEAEADKIYAGLSAGGDASMPMQKMFWGDYFGMLTDKYGVQWMISFTAEPHM